MTSNSVVRTTVDAIGRWAKAMESGDLHTAMAIAENISRYGEPLLLYPEFDRAARAYCQGIDAETALRSTGWFFMAMTEFASPDRRGREATDAGSAPGVQQRHET